MAESADDFSLIYMIDKNYKIVSFSKEIADKFPSFEVGKLCYDCFGGEFKPCHNCPISNNICKNSALFNKEPGKLFNVYAGSIDVPGKGECYVFMLREMGGVAKAGNTVAEERSNLFANPDYDALTGLLKRKAYFKKVDEYIHKDDAEYCIMAIDIEHFSFFNKWYGRAAGDRLLKAVGKYLKETDLKLRTLSGYTGGDNFCSVFKYDEGLCESISKGLTNLLEGFEGGENFRPVFGGYIISNKEMHIGDMYDNAVVAASRVMGRLDSSICWFNVNLVQRLENELKLMPEIQKGIDNGEFTFYLQPKCNIKTGKIVGAEALVRWIHPERGLIPPIQFIPMLEQNGYIVNLDKYIWEEVCKTLRRWIDRGDDPLPISVNVSRVDIYRMDVVEYFSELTGKYSLPARYIEIEITESAYIENENIIKETEEGLKKAGFSVLIDDFGSGYSSLNMLKDAHADMLKLDMKFLDLDENNITTGVNIITSVLEMAHQIKLLTISEGIETEKQSQILSALGCEYGQGYYFYRPMPIEKYEEIVANKDNVESRRMQYRPPMKSYFKEITDYFIKVAEVNLATGEYFFVKNNITHERINVPPARTIEEYIKRFIDAKVIHPDDVKEYLKISNLSNIRERIKENKYRQRYVLRYKLKKEYEWIVFEVTIPQGFREEEPWILFSWKEADSEASNMEDALKLVYNTHYKILKINITDDSYEVIKLKYEEPAIERHKCRHISEWFKIFADDGCIYAGDESKFREFTNLEYLREYFKNTRDSITCNYRRLVEGKYVWVTMELAPSMEYTDDNQVIMLYIRSKDADNELKRLNKNVLRK